jgi:hypothetical protein
MRTAFLLVLIYLALIAQTALAPQLALGGIAPRFIPLATYLVLACSRPRLGLVLAAGCGLAADCVSPGPLGLELAACVLMAATSLRWQLRGTLSRLIPAGWLLQLLLTLETACVTAVRLWWVDRAVEPAAVLGFATASALYTSLIGFVLMRWLPPWALAAPGSVRTQVVA